MRPIYHNKLLVIALMLLRTNSSSGTIMTAGNPNVNGNLDLERSTTSNTSASHYSINIAGNFSKPSADVSNLAQGLYFVIDKKGEAHKLAIVR